jgi:hypothetical protein
VVPPALEDLRQEALDATTLAGERRMEEDEARFHGSLGLNRNPSAHDDLLRTLQRGQGPGPDNRRPSFPYSDIS